MERRGRLGMEAAGTAQEAGKNLEMTRTITAVAEAYLLKPYWADTFF
jgi:hypothetical protein